MRSSVLIVLADADLARRLSRVLDGDGWYTEIAGTVAEARVQMDSLRPDVVLLDPRLPDAHGTDALGELRRIDTGTDLVVFAGATSIEPAVALTRRGAIDCLTGPADVQHIASMLHDVAHARRTRRGRASQACGGGAPSREALTAYPSPAMRRVRALAERAAAQEGIVLLLGESGTGKDWLARWIHDHSARATGPFFSLNCAALPRELAESELFGHEPGAYTGSQGRKRGLLELAENGTILLDEVGDLDLPLQAKLLTFLDTRSFVRVGGERHVSVRARIIAATNRDLRAAVAVGSFRADLYYRIAVFLIHMPPLRERIEDIPVLVASLLEQATHELALTALPALAPRTIEAIKQYPWPGNVRELRNVLERAVMLRDGQPLRPADLHLDPPTSEWSLEVPFPAGLTLYELLDNIARKVVLEALRRSDGSRKGAAEMLGLSRHSLGHLMRRLGVGR